MPNKEFYEYCVDKIYRIEPVDRLGEHVIGEQGCYKGPFEYRAPGYFQGTGVTIAFPSIVNENFAIESVYDFATFEHSYFINGTDQYPGMFGVGFSDFVAGAMVNQYAGLVQGFRTDKSIDNDYSGAAFTGTFGASIGPAIFDPIGPSVGIGHMGFNSISDFKVRGNGIYVSLGFGVDAISPLDAGVGLISMTNNPFPFNQSTNYKSGNSILKPQLFTDILIAKHNVWLSNYNPTSYTHGFAGRAAIASMAMHYARVYEEINYEK